MFQRIVIASVFFALGLLCTGDLRAAILLGQDSNPRLLGKAGETVEGMIRLTNVHAHPVKVIIGMEERTTAYPPPIPEWLYFEQQEIVLKPKEIYPLTYRMKILPQATGQLIKRVYFDERPATNDGQKASRQGFKINFRRSTYFVVTIAGTEHYAGAIRRLTVDLEEGKTFTITLQNSGNMYVKAAGQARLYDRDSMVLLETIVLNSGKKAILAKRLTDFKGIFKKVLQPGSYLLRVHFPFPDEESALLKETKFTIPEPNDSGTPPSPPFINQYKQEGMKE